MGIASVRKQILNDLPRNDSVETWLRLAYSGSEVSELLLKREKFQCVDYLMTHSVFVWSKFFKNTEHQILLDTDVYGRILRIRLAKRILYEDTINDCLGEKWIDILMNDEFEHEEVYKKSLQKCEIKPLLLEAQEEWTTLRNFCGLEQLGDIDLNEMGFRTCCDCFGLWDKKDKASAAMLVTSLVRHIEHVTHPYALMDLPFLAGRLELVGECLIALRNLLESDIIITPEGWSNLGAVLSDNVRLQRSAMTCFKIAISLQPNLKPPQQAIWVAANRLMGEALLEDNYEDILAIGEEVEKYGDISSAHHGVWSYCGLACEMLGYKDNAIIYYKKALQTDSECRESKDALSRLSVVNHYDMFLRRAVDEWKIGIKQRQRRTIEF